MLTTNSVCTYSMSTRPTWCFTGKFNQSRTTAPICSMLTYSQAVLILSMGIFLGFNTVPYYKYSATGIIGTSTAGLVTT